MSDEEWLEPPDTDVAEGISGAIAIVFGQVPGVGMLVDAIDRAVQSEIKRRDRVYMVSVFRRLQERLDHHELILAQLSEAQRSSFFTALMYTREIARRTEDLDKLAVLRNETINSAMPSAPTDDLRQVYIAMTATLTGLHLRIFGLLLKPERAIPGVESYRDLESKYKGDGPWETRAWDTIKRYVAGATDNDVIQHCINDLINQGVVAYHGNPLLGVMFPQPTNFGWGFYSFMTDENPE